MKHSGPRLLVLLVAGCGGSSPPSAPSAPAPSTAPAPAISTARTPAGTCEASAARTMELRDHAMFSALPTDKQALWQSRYAELLTTACREDAWPQAVIDCAVTAADVPALEGCGDGLDRPALEKMGARIQPFLEALVADVKTSYTPAVAPGTPSLAAWTSGETGIAACDDYAFMFEAFIACPKTPPSADEVARDALAIMKDSWRRFRDPGVPAKERQAVADACQEEALNVRAAATAAGCPIPEAPPPALIATPQPPAKTKKAKK